MSYQVLARKWRPHYLQDVVGQDHIVKSLQNALKENRFGHAYIFSGTRGIGKTSVARIFAKSIRCLNRKPDGNFCGECAACDDFNTNSSMNIIEIDGASNNGVDDVRDLISNVYYVPTTGKYKVYIIDEVHMLSNNAFNALLKTLEEPPEHAIFILATTEPDKLLGTVQSRCQRLDFRNAEVKDIVSQITKIALSEGIKFENESLVMSLAKLGNGSFRDSLSLLDQVLSFSIDKFISEDIFAKSLGLAKVSTIKNILSAMALGDLESLSKNYRESLFENVNPKSLSKSVLESLFSIVMAKDVGDYNRVSARISKDAFDSLDRAECYWIYEVISGDINWALASICVEDAIELILRKVTSRKTFFNSEKIEENETEAKKKIESEQRIIKVEKPIEQTSNFVPAVEAIINEAPVERFEVEEPNYPEVIQEEIKTEQKPQEMNWDTFLDYFKNVSPAAASNLEQGNLLSPISYTQTSLVINLGFPQSAKVFYEYLSENEPKEKLVKNLAQYFNLEVSKIQLDMTLITKEENKEDFKSKVEIKHEEHLKQVKEKEEAIANDPVISYAETLFNSKVDKIILTDKK